MAQVLLPGKLEVPESSQDLKLTIKERYTSAANEITQRIALRQQVQIGFVVAVFTVLSWFLTQPDQALLTPRYQLMCALVPMLGIVFTCWAGQNDLLVGLLCAFCRACQQADDGFTDDGSRPDKEQPWKTPNWFSRTQIWAAQGFLYRAMANVAYSAVLFCTTIPMTVVLLTNLGAEKSGVSEGQQTLAMVQVTLLALFLALGIITPIAWWISHADLEKGYGAKIWAKNSPTSDFKGMVGITILLLLVAISLYWFSHDSNYKFQRQQRFVLHVSFVTMLMTIGSLVLQHYYTSERIRILVYGELVYASDENGHKYLRLSLENLERRKTPDRVKYATEAQTKANRRLERIGTLEKIAVWVVFFGLMLLFAFLWKSR